MVIYSHPAVTCRSIKHSRSAAPLLMNTWHTVQFWLIGRQGYLQVNSEEKMESSFAHGPLVQLTLDQRLYLGSHPEPDLLSASLTQRMPKLVYPQLAGFRGCVQELVMNGHSFDLIAEALGGANVDNCQDQPCAQHNVCADEAECVAYTNDYYCLCPLGSYGIRCQQNVPRKELKRLAFTGRSYLEFNSLELSKILSMPHFDIYLDMKITTFGQINLRSESSVLRDHPQSPVHNTLLFTMVDSSTRKPCVTIHLVSDPYHHFHHRLALTSGIGLEADNQSTVYENRSNGTSGTVGNPRLRTVGHVTVNEWHKLMLKRRGDSFSLYLNGTIIAEVLWEPNRLWCSTLDYLYLGGIPRRYNFFWSEFGLQPPEWATVKKLKMRSIYNGFNGCIENLYLNGKSFLSTQASDGRNIEECGS